jgi:hypothetical protein
MAYSVQFDKYLIVGGVRNAGTATRKRDDNDEKRYRILIVEGAFIKGRIVDEGTRKRGGVSGL